MTFSNQGKRLAAAGALLMGVAIVPSYAKSGGVNQSTSGIVIAGPVGSTCYDDGCAKVTTVRVHLPLDANIVKIRLMSAGVGRDDLHENNPGDDIQWARWAAPVQGTTPTNKYVEGRFLNRSENQNRKVQVVVDWTSRR